MAENTPLIAAIGAVASNGMLGLDGWLPWDIPEELAYFESTVAGAALVIGRLTYESMDVVPADSFIVSRQSDLSLRPGCHRVDSVEQGLAAALATGKPVFVIGGNFQMAAMRPSCGRTGCKLWMAAPANAETVSIETRPAGAGSISCHWACEHHQAVMGTLLPLDSGRSS